MYRYILEDSRHILPFNEPASRLTIDGAAHHSSGKPVRGIF